MKRAIPILYRRPRESGGPGATARRSPWVPAFAGMTAKELIFQNSFRVGLSKPQIEFADELVVVELVGGAAFEGDLAVDDDVAAVGDADGLVEVLLGHQHGQLVAVLQLLDLLDC